MQLLFDQNLSPKLVDRLADLFPGSVHVRSVGLEQATDLEVWEHARSHSLSIVTKDEDFQSLSVVQGSPPKVICMQAGNCTTAQLEAIIRSGSADIEAFVNDPDSGTLILG